MQAPDSSIICFAYNIDPDGNPGVPVGSGYFLGYLYFLSGQWYIDFQFEPDEHGPFFGYTMIGTNGCDLSSFVVQYVNSDLTLQDGWQVRVVSP